MAPLHPASNATPEPFVRFKLKSEILCLIGTVHLLRLYQDIVALNVPKLEKTSLKIRKQSREIRLQCAVGNGKVNTSWLLHSDKLEWRNAELVL